MKPSPQRILLLVLALALAGGLIFAFLPRPVAVDIAVVTRGPLELTVNSDGRTRIKDRYIVSTPLGGRLQRIELHPGDAVEAGRTLLTTIEPAIPELLDPRTRAQAEARLKSSAAAREQATPLLERARTTWGFARTELERARRLQRDNTLSMQEFDTAEQRERTTAMEMRAAQFAVQIADFELDLARAALLRADPAATRNSDSWNFPILSPITGRVLRVFQESSTVVPAGARLLELGDPAALEVEIDVLSADAVRIKPGARVLLDHWGGDAPLVGRVRLVEPSGFLKVSALGVEEQRVNVIVDFVSPPEARPTLGDAYRVEARIVVWEHGDVLKVPVGALFRQGDDWAVFTMAEGSAKLQRITVGQRNDLEAEVKEGLATGARVIVHPSDQVQEGARIKAR